VDLTTISKILNKNKKREKRKKQGVLYIFKSWPWPNCWSNSREG